MPNDVQTMQDSIVIFNSKTKIR